MRAEPTPHATPPAGPTTVWSVGHSNVALDELVALLREKRIERVVDVRRWPRSRRHPHFSRESLAGALPRAGVLYEHAEALGGHRETRADSPHRALPLGPFRAYADHMETAEFARALARLLELARERRTAVMCAEARFVDCHRRILCDRLVAGGVDVVHVRRGAPDEPHRASELAVLEGGRLVYRSAAPAQRGLFDGLG